MADDEGNQLEPQLSDLDLRILSPSAELSGPLNLTVPRSMTVAGLKLRIKDALPSKPEPTRQRLIHRGKVMADESKDLTAIFGQDEIKRSESISLHLVLKELPATDPSRSSAAPLGASRSGPTPNQPRIDQPNGGPTSHPVPPNSTSNIPPAAAAAAAGALPPISLPGLFPFPNALNLHQQALALAQGQLHPTMQAAFPPHIHHHHGPHTHHHRPATQAASPSPISGGPGQPPVHAPDRSSTSSPNPSGNQLGVRQTRARLNVSHSDPNLAARALAQQQLLHPHIPGPFTSPPVRAASGHYTVTMESTVTSFQPNHAAHPHTAHQVAYHLPQGPAVFAQPQNRSHLRIHHPPASTQVYLLSSPTGPHALLVGPSGAYSSDNIPQGTWGSLLNAQTPQHDASSGHATQRLHTLIPNQPSFSRQPQYAPSPHPSYQPIHQHHQIIPTLGQPPTPQTHPLPQSSAASTSPAQEPPTHHPRAHAPPNPLPNGIPPDPQPNADANADANAFDNILLPAMGHLWLVVRIVGIWYLFRGTTTSLGPSTENLMLLTSLGLILFLTYAGGLLGEALHRLRAYVDHLVLGEEHQENPAPPRPEVQAARPPSPEQLANRIHEGTPLRRLAQRGREQLRGVERAVALFLGSLYPGFGERVVRERERREREEQEEEERLAREEEERRAREEEERQAREEPVAGAEDTEAARDGAARGLRDEAEREVVDDPVERDEQTQARGVRDGEARMQRMRAAVADGEVDAEPRVVGERRPMWDLGGDGDSHGSGEATSTGRDPPSGGAGLTSRVRGEEPSNGVGLTK